MLSRSICRSTALQYSFAQNIRFRWYSTNSSFDTNDKNNTTTTTYLHVGPSGDCWTGTSLFAAKHLTPDYVRSIPLPSYWDEDVLTRLLHQLEEEPQWCHQIYDTQKIPDELLKTIVTKEVEDDQS